MADELHLDALVKEAADGDQQAWDTLVSRFNGLVWSVARGHRLSSSDAADVVQTTWLRLVEHLDRIRDPQRVGSWLATTARNESLAVIRKAKRAMPTDDTYLDVADPAAPAVDQRVLDAERDRSLLRALALLSERCSRLLRILMASPPPSYDEVGAALDMPIGSIGPTRARCLDKLRQVLPEVGINPGGASSF